MKVFDMNGTLRREPFRGSARARKGRARVVAIASGTALFMSIAPVSSGSIDAIRLVKDLADYQLTDKQLACHNEIVHRESRWDYKAIGNKSGTKQVYGLYQMKTESLKRSTPIKQFWMYWHYVGYRYGWTVYDEPHYCGALLHLKTKGWQ
jgi:hypothetical protein